MESIVSAWMEMVCPSSVVEVKGKRRALTRGSAGDPQRGAQAQAHLYRDARRAGDERRAGQLPQGELGALAMSCARVRVGSSADVSLDRLATMAGALYSSRSRVGRYRRGSISTTTMDEPSSCSASLTRCAKSLAADLSGPPPSPKLTSLLAFAHNSTRNLASSRRDWSTCATPTAFARTISSPSTPCAMPLSASGVSCAERRITG